MVGELLSQCQFLEWDSAFFGFRIGRLQPDSLTPEVVADALSWCRREKIRCLYFLARPDSPETTALAESHGFRLVDIRLTLRRKPDRAHGPYNFVRPCREADLPTLRRIAAASHRDSRFYYDAGFPAALCDALYKTWIERSCNGYAEAVFVADYRDQPSGYISCHVNGSVGSIGLIAVAENARGRGLGSQLVAAALAYFSQTRCSEVSVVTQGRNCAAQSLYQTTGFRTASVRLWYHRWFEPERSDL
jgi:dTDP-4-amino-4,6-dideoxy-D-galactose acyltransferase